jgi:hypothetical protein
MHSTPHSQPAAAVAKTMHKPAEHRQPAAAVAKTKHHPAMHSQPAAAAVVETKHNLTMQLPFKDEEQVNLQIVFSSPHLPAKPFQLSVLAAYVAASIDRVC